MLVDDFGLKFAVQRIYPRFLCDYQFIFHLAHPKIFPFSYNHNLKTLISQDVLFLIKCHHKVPRKGGGVSGTT